MMLFRQIPFLFCFIITVSVLLCATVNSMDNTNQAIVEENLEENIDLSLSNDQITSNNVSENDTNFLSSNFTVQVDSSRQNISVNHSSIVNNSSNTNLNTSTVRVVCLLNKTFDGQSVEIVNTTVLASILHTDSNVTSRKMPANCVVVLFYSPACPFSSQAAPHFNALPRFFPPIRMVALDAITYKNYNAQYGIFGIPTLLLFHNGKPIARFNETSNYSLEMFAKFIGTCTNVKPIGKLVVTSGDFAGPLSSVPVKDKDYYLLLSWVVIGLRILYSLYHSSWGRWLIDATLSAWREAEAQHHHID